MLPNSANKTARKTAKDYEMLNARIDDIVREAGTNDDDEDEDEIYDSMLSEEYQELSERMNKLYDTEIDDLANYLKVMNDAKNTTNKNYNDNNNSSSNNTNNEAEYMGLLIGMRKAVEMGIDSLLIRGDSQLIIRQMKGEYKVKSDALKPLYNEALQLASSIPTIQYEHVYRTFNKRADKLSNLGLLKG